MPPQSRIGALELLAAEIEQRIKGWHQRHMTMFSGEIVAEELEGWLNRVKALAVTPASEKLSQLAPPTQDEIADYRDLFRRELDKNMHNSSSSPSTEAHGVALRTFVDKRNAANR